MNARLQPEIITPFLFGKNNKLFACHHRPITGKEKDTCFIICNPIAQEYEHGHRALRPLASQLCKQGFHVFRFDYSGTGDSLGLFENSSIETWVGDINLAIDTFKKRSIKTKVAILGLRFGATLAAKAIASRNDIACFTAWSPIASGKDQLAQWKKQQSVHEAALSYITTSKPFDEIMAFYVPKELQKDIEKLDIRELPLEKPRLLVCISHEKTLPFVWLSQANYEKNINIDCSTIIPWKPNTNESVVPGKFIRDLSLYFAQELS